MKNRAMYLCFGFALVILSMLYVKTAFSFASREVPYAAEGRILVKINPTSKQHDIPNLNGTASSIAGMSIEKTWDIDITNQSALKSRNDQGTAKANSYYALLTSKTMSVKEMLANAAKSPYIEYAEPDYKIFLTSVPNDPGYKEQWTYDNKIKNSNGISADINIHHVWDKKPTVSDDIVVAVVDTGIDYNHPDLDGNIWNGTAYGYPKHGWNCAEDTNDPIDIEGHGTHVSGIITARKNNGIGVAGVAEDIKIIAMRIFPVEKVGFSSSVVDAYSRLSALKSKGVNIVATNNSWVSIALSRIAMEAMENLGSKGVINVIAAANESADNDETLGFPFNSGSGHSIVVAASTPWDEIASFSNYGRKNVHTAAPGTHILSTYIKKPNSTSFVPSLAQSSDIVYKNDFENLNDIVLSTDGAKGEQNVLIKDGYLQWEISAATKGTFHLTISKDIEFVLTSRDTVQLNMPKLNNKNVQFNITTGKNKDETFHWNILSNKSSFANSWQIESNLLHDPIDPTFDDPELAPEISPWFSKGHIVIDVSLEAKESAKILIKNIYIYKYGKTTDYHYADGTSMAAPAVTGAVALLASRKQGISEQELRARIIGGAVKIDSMFSKVLSGGRLDVKKAFESPSPVVNSLTLSHDKIIIDGYFFGAAAGNVTLNNGSTVIPISLENWTDNRITAVLPKVKCENAEITVQRPDKDWGRNNINLNEQKTSWEKLAPAPYAFIKTHIVGNEKDQEIYMLNGENDEFCPCFYSYSVKDNTWTDLGQLPKEFTEPEIVLSGKIYPEIKGVMHKEKLTVARIYTDKSITIGTYSDGKWKLKTYLTSSMPKEMKNTDISALASINGRLFILAKPFYPPNGIFWEYDDAAGSFKNIASCDLSSRRNAVYSVSDKYIMIAGGEREQSRAPIIFDGVNAYKGKDIPILSDEQFLWKHAAGGIFKDVLYMTGGTMSQGDSFMKNGARYIPSNNTWEPLSFSEGNSIRNCGASIVMGDYIYRTAITDFSKGVENSFERLCLAEKQEDGKSSGCNGGFGIKALLLILPALMIKFSRRK